MKISSKIWKIIWISGIYILLFIILYLVVIYKVEWEDKDLNTYLYFYNCNHELCSSTTKQDDYYSKIVCENNVCPYIESVIGNNLILRKENNSWIYNYITDKIINNSYIDYRYIGHDMFVVTNDTNNQGVINLSGEILVSPKYDYIDDYNNGIISYKKDNLFGIDTVDNIYQVSNDYEDIVLINDKIFAGRKDNIYHLYSYNDVNNENANKYNFVYAYEDIILVANNKKIDILDTKLNSTLLIKIDSFYEYTIEKERDSLDIYVDEGILYFNVFISETEYTTYKYNISTKKLV
ncbi:MAG: WG repeat-containing protein [Bacilli bacterium]|nr:WG repeat-containing protein [Bacilli bacterium]